MDYQLSKKGRLPAVILDKTFMEDLWAIFNREGEFIWNAVVGTGGDPLGKNTERQQQVVHEWTQLGQMLASERLDFVQIVVEYPEKGTVSVILKNFDPARGLLIVAGQEQQWVDTISDVLNKAFASVKEDFNTKLYSRSGSLLIHSVIPLLASCLIIIGLTAFLIPGHIRRSELIWWISVGTVVATLKLAQILSDRLVIYLLGRYPYFQWAD